MRELPFSYLKMDSLGRCYEFQTPARSLTQESAAVFSSPERFVAVASKQREDAKARQNEQMWDLRAETYDRRLGFLYWAQKKMISLLRLEALKDPYLLDLACGTGWAVRYAACLAAGRGEFYGVDISSRMIAVAEAGSVGYKNAHFRKASVEELPFGDGFFDVITCSNAFHHFSNPENVLMEAYRVLKPRGKIYVLDATADDFLTRTLGRLAPKLEPSHVKLYSTREFRAFFEKAGLCYVTSRSIVFSVKTHIAEKIGAMKISNT